MMKLPRSRRIAHRGDFDRVRTQGRSIRGHFLVLGYLADANLTESFRLGLITTKRLGGAVVRNRVRRRLRGILHRTGELVTQPHWIVLIARTPAATASSAQLEKEWHWLLRKASLSKTSGEKE